MENQYSWGTATTGKYGVVNPNASGSSLSEVNNGSPAVPPLDTYEDDRISNFSSGSLSPRQYSLTCPALDARTIQYYMKKASTGHWLRRGKKLQVMATTRGAVVARYGPKGHTFCLQDIESVDGALKFSVFAIGYFVALQSLGLYSVIMYPLSPLRKHWDQGLTFPMYFFLGAVLACDLLYLRLVCGAPGYIAYNYRGRRIAAVDSPPQQAMTQPTSPRRQVGGSFHLDGPPVLEVTPPASAQPLSGDTFNQLCEYCQVVRPLRAKHCHQCGRCVFRFDHHCTWLSSCVGARNHGPFLVLVLLLFTTISAGLWLSYSAMLPASGWFEMFRMNKVATMTLIGGGPMLLAIFALNLFTCAVVSNGETTYEMLKGHKIPYLKKGRNPFNRGFIGNIRALFNSSPENTDGWPSDPALPEGGTHRRGSGSASTPGAPDSVV